MPSPQVNLGRFGQTVAGVSVVGNTEISPPPSGTTIQVDAAPAGAGVLVNGSGTALSQVTDTTQPIVRVTDGVETCDLTLVGHVGILRTVGPHDILIQTNSTTAIDVNGTTGVVTFPLGIGSPLTLTGQVTINAPSTAVPALVVHGVSGQAAISVTTSGAGSQGLVVTAPAATTAGLFQLNQSGQTTWSMFETASSNTLHLWNNVQTDVMLFGGAGNVTVNAPASGDALTINAVASGRGIVVNQASGQTGLVIVPATITQDAEQISSLVGGQGSMLFQGNNANVLRVGGMGAAGQIVSGGAAGDAAINVIGTGTLRFGTNTGVDRMDISSTGAVTINAPTSGTGLTIAGGGLSVTGTSALGALTATTGTFTGLLQAQLGLTVTGGTTTTAALSASTINASGLITGTAGATISGGTTTTAALSATTGTFSGLVSAQLGLNVTGAAFTSRGITDNATSTSTTINSTGNVTIAGAASGTTLTVNGVTAINAGGAGGGAQFVAPAATQSGIEIAQASQTTWLIREPASSNDLRIWNGSDVITMTSTGNVTVAAPASGNAFTANGVSGGWASQIIAAGSGTELGLDILGGTLGTDVSFQVENHAGSIRSIRVFGDGSGYVGANATNNLSWNATGNWIMAAPTSGIGLIVNGVANAYAETIVGASATSYGLNLKAGTGSTDTCLLIQSQSAVTTFMSIFGDGHGGLGPNLTWTVGGTFAIAPPASGQSLTISGLANSGTCTISAGANTSGTHWALYVTDTSSTAGFSNGLFVQAGGNISDTSFQAQTASGTQICRLLGDASGSIGPYPNSMQWDHTGAFSLIGTATFGTFSKAQNGYEISPNGIKRMWGKASVTTGTPASVSFTPNFATVYSLTCSLDSPASGANVVYTTGISGTGFTANVQSGAGSNNVFWHATGV